MVFRSGQQQPTAGALVIGAEGLGLEGGAAAAHVELSVAYTELTDVRIGRNRHERLDGRPTLLLGREGKPSIQVEPLGLGFLGEIADLLTALARQPPESDRVALIVPLKKGRLARVEELVAQGPPFDPAALDLTRHQIYLSEQEATFVFIGPDVRATLAQTARDPTLWRAGLAWRSCITGPPRLANAAETPPGHHARLVYTWPPTDNQDTRTATRDQ